MIRHEHSLRADIHGLEMKLLMPYTILNAKYLECDNLDSILVLAR